MKKVSRTGAPEMSLRPVRAASRNRGFTLIELMTVVAIIGVVAAMAIPNVNQRIQVEREAAALAEVKGALTSFRNLARTKVVCVQVAVVGNTLTAAPYIQCNPLANPLPVETFKFEEGFDKKVKILAFSGPGLIGNPVFQKRGGLLLNGPLKLTVQTLSDGVVHDLFAYPATGMVRMR